MKRLALSSLIVLSWAAIAPAGELVKDIAWPEREAAGNLSGGTVQPDGTLLVENDENGPATIGLATLDASGITRPVYALRGQVRCQDVSPDSYLEMWSVFPDGEKHFSRTLAVGGLMRKLDGTSDWREFVLPYYSETGDPTPTRLELNLVLTGPGRVELRPMTLMQYEAGESPMVRAGAWWGDRTGALIGGMIGAMVGVLGAVIGVLAGSGRARGLVVALLRTMVAGGIALVVTGLTALALGQPYGVYYPLVLAGLIPGILGFVLLPTIRRRYEQIELGRIEALDANASSTAR